MLNNMLNNMFNNIENMINMNNNMLNNIIGNNSISSNYLYDSSNNMLNNSIGNKSISSNFIYDSSNNIINNKNSKNKINNYSNLIIPKFDDFNEFRNINNKKYTIVNLKNICKHYKLKTTGIKTELYARIYIYLKDSYYALKIQKITKKYLFKLLNYYKGPALIKRKLCINDTDFMSMDPIYDINYCEFISYRDEDNYVYGFNIVSLYNWIVKSLNENKDIINPYNRNKFPSELIKNVRLIIKLSKLLKININLVIENDKKDSLSEMNNKKTIELFQNMDQLGFYTDILWFNNLNYYDLIKFIKELNDIWTYRAQLSYETKHMICQNQNPFYNCYEFIHYNVHINPQVNIDVLKNKILIIIDRIINFGSSTEYKYLGASYVLMALTLVSSSAAEAMPWLYHSVA